MTDCKTEMLFILKSWDISTAWFGKLIMAVGSVAYSPASLACNIFL